MAHFTKIGVGNIVSSVEVVNNAVLMKDGKEDEATGIKFLQDLYNNKDTYIQTSYNNNFRKNYAGIGYIYDETRDAFIAPKPFPSWILNEDTCKWDAPVPYPDAGKNPESGKFYSWNEDTTSWIEVD